MKFHTELRGGDVGSSVESLFFFCPCKFPVTNCNDKVKVIVPYAFMIYAYMIYTKYIYIYIYLCCKCSRHLLVGRTCEATNFELSQRQHHPRHPQGPPNRPGPTQHSCWSLWLPRYLSEFIRFVEKGCAIYIPWVFFCFGGCLLLAKHFLCVGCWARPGNLTLMPWPSANWRRPFV